MYMRFLKKACQKIDDLKRSFNKGIFSHSIGYKVTNEDKISSMSKIKITMHFTVQISKYFHLKY